ncbi:DUF4232 domain-containing protein [Actinoplanes sp. NPDC051411]|uniref:DUF4232 domain-containing protein n=1 Tax=Actinoplanes sp. NPDC051411 TaxID=3155522 RepID=UPI003412C210
MKRLAVAVLSLALLAACNAPEPGYDAYGHRLPPRPTSTTPGRRADPPTTPAQTPPPTCPPEGVLLRSGGTDGAAGLRALGITLLNCGKKNYRVDGYPTVRALDKDHHAAAVKVLHGVADIAGPIPDWNGPPAPVTLKPGQQAECVVVWRNTYDDIRRPPVNAPYLQMAPEPGRPAQLLTPDGALDLGSTGRLGVSPWRRSKSVPPTTRPAPPEHPAVQPAASALNRDRRGRDSATVRPWRISCLLPVRGSERGRGTTWCRICGRPATTPTR